MLLTEWRDVWRVTEMECVWSVEADIFHLRCWPIEVSPDTTLLLHFKKWWMRSSKMKFMKHGSLSTDNILIFTKDLYGNLGNITLTRRILQKLLCFFSSLTHVEHVSFISVSLLTWFLCYCFKDMCFPSSFHSCFNMQSTYVLHTCRQQDFYICLPCFICWSFTARTK